MAVIESVEIHPNTQGAGAYGVGLGGGPYPYKRIITDIKIVTEANDTIIQIFVENQLYAEYANVPYAIFYKLDEVSKQQK